MLEAKKVNKLSDIAAKNRLDKMIKLKKNYLKRVATEGYDTVLSEMKLMQGNSKTGQNCRTVSLIPVHDCVNCYECSLLCYDLRNDCIYPSVLNDRAKNSALREANPTMFWKRVGELVNEECVTELRLNVGGDLRDEDFPLVNDYVALANPSTGILFFTKNYKGINAYMDKQIPEPNMKAIMSAWIGMEMENPHNLPCSHVMWENGKTTAPEYGAYMCQGNCSRCHFNREGCWTLKNGESVVFMAH